MSEQIKFQPWRCRYCGHVGDPPPSEIARMTGFDSRRHCGIIANNLGRNVDCKKLNERFKLCEECETYWNFTKKSDKVGYK